MKLFSEILGFSKKTPSHDTETGEKYHNDDVAAFHAKHKELEEIAHRLHASGHHITVDYKDPHVIKSSKSGSTHFWNRGLHTEKKIQISKKMPLRPW